MAVWSVCALVVPGFIAATLQWVLSYMLLLEIVTVKFTQQTVSVQGE